MAKARAMLYFPVRHILCVLIFASVLPFPRVPEVLMDQSVSRGRKVSR